MGKIIEVKMYVDDKTGEEKILNKVTNELGEYENEIFKKLLDMDVNLTNFTAGKVQTKIKDLLMDNLAEVSTVTNTIYGNVNLSNMSKVLNALIDAEIIKGESK